MNVTNPPVLSSSFNKVVLPRAAGESLYLLMGP